MNPTELKRLDDAIAKYEAEGKQDEVARLTKLKQRLQETEARLIANASRLRLNAPRATATAKPCCRRKKVE